MIRPTHPPRLKPSSPAGSWMTPSRETLSLTTIFPISILLVGVVSYHVGGVVEENPRVLGREFEA